MKNMLIVLLAALFMSSSFAEGKLPKESNVIVTKELKGHRWGNIYFSGQPSEADMAALKKSGFATIINLRGKKEKNYLEAKESKIMKEQGLNYYNVPFSMKDEMSDTYVSSVTEKVMKHRKEGKILIHCSSGNRVAVWLGAHFKKDHKFSNEKSLTLAKELGLTKKAAEDKLNSYLK